MSLITPILDGTSTRSHHPLLVVQSSSAQSSLPVLRRIVALGVQEKHPKTLIMFCFLHPPAKILPIQYSKERVVVHDLSDRIPGYDEQPEPIQEVLRLLDDVPSTLPVDVIIDSVDALITNFNPLSDSYVKLREILLITLRHPRPSRLVIHLNEECPLLPLIIQRSFSPISLAHFIAYPASLINYISTSYLTDPPPLSAQEKFWAVFVPLSERRREIMRIVHDPNGAGPNPREFVIELTIRGNAASRKDRNVSRYLEGWSIDQNGPCKLSELESCNPIWSKRHAMETPDSIPSHGVSFNLELTEAQQQSRARVPLPYAHEGKLVNQETTILYDPDSADDIDDDDPDEDLNL